MNVFQPYFLKHFPRAKIINLSEYDYTPTNQPCHTMGLAKDSIGVLIPDLESKNDTPLQNTGLNKFALDEHYFFGYINNTSGMQVDPKQQESFIQSAVVIAEKEKHKQVQMVTNIPWNTVQALHPSLKDKIGKIEYYSSSGEVNTVEFPSSSATKVLKIFNPFPLKPEEFQTLLLKSHIFALCTGDQSLIENIFASKCVFYQVMRWKNNLSSTFIEFVKDVCGQDSMYYHLVHLAISTPDKVPEFLEKKWDSDPAMKSKIQSDAKKLANAIKEKKNVNHLLLKLIQLSLLPEEKLDSPDLLQNVHTCCELLIILDAFKNNGSKIEHILQSMERKLPDMINSIDDFAKILNLNGTMKQLSILLSAMSKKLPSIIENAEQLYSLLNLPLAPEQSSMIWNSVQGKLESLFRFQNEFNKFMMLTSRELTSEQRSKILDAVQAKLPTWIQTFDDFKNILFTLSRTHMKSEHRAQILIILHPKLESLIEYSFELKELLNLDNTLLTLEHRTQILTSLQENFSKLISNHYELQCLFGLPQKKLSSEHRKLIMESPSVSALLLTLNEFEIGAINFSDQELATITALRTSEKDVANSTRFFKPPPEDKTTPQIKPCRKIL